MNPLPHSANKDLKQSFVNELICNRQDNFKLLANAEQRKMICSQENEIIYLLARMGMYQANKVN